MSKKNRSKQVNAESPFNRSGLIVAAVGVLVIAIVAATLLYDGAENPSERGAGGTRAAALASPPVKGLSSFGA